MPIFPLLRICVAAVCDVAFAGVVGILLSRVWLKAAPDDGARLRAAFAVCCALLLVAIPLQMLLLSAAMTGDESWKAAWAALGDVMGTHTGRAVLLSFVPVPLLVAFSLSKWERRGVGWPVAGLVLVVLSIACRACCGHAAADGDFTLREVVQFLHLAFIDVWGGGVLAAGLLTAPLLAATQGAAAVIAFIKRLSMTVTVALVFVFGSGLYNAWRGLGGSIAGSAAGLQHTGWGRMLVLKVCLVLLVLLHGARVRTLLGRRVPATEERVRGMVRWLRMESALMLCVFVVSAWLANLPPADM